MSVHTITTTTLSIDVIRLKNKKMSDDSEIIPWSKQYQFLFKHFQDIIFNIVILSFHIIFVMVKT